MEENIGLDILNSSVNTLEELTEVDKEIDLSTGEYKSVIFNRQDLLDMINLAIPIVLPKSEQVVYNSITFISQPDTKTLAMIATNELSMLRYTTEQLGNSDNILSGVFSISLVTLQKIVKLMGNKVLFYIKDDCLFTRLLDGDLNLDIRLPSLNRLTLPGKLTDKIAELSLANLGYIVNTINPIMNVELKGDSRKITFLGDKAYYQSPYYYIESKIKTPPLVIKARDAEVISRIYSNKRYRDKTIQLFNIEAYVNRIKMIVDNLEYTFISGEASQSELMKNQLERISKEPEAEIELERLNRLVSLAVNLPESEDKFTLEFSDTDLRVTIYSTKGKSNFSIPIEKRTNSLYRKPISINSDLLRRLLFAFSGNEKVEIAFTDYSIVVNKGGIKAILINIT